jgi:hypothetical protein
VQLKDILKKKSRTTGRSPRRSCSCTIPQLTRHLQPRRNWPTWASNVLITTLVSGSGPVGLPPVPWTEKKTFFCPTRRSLLPRRPGWMDILLMFVCVCVYWALWGVCWINPKFCHCRLFIVSSLVALRADQHPHPQKLYYQLPFLC